MIEEVPGRIDYDENGSGPTDLQALLFGANKFQFLDASMDTTLQAALPPLCTIRVALSR